MLQKVLSEKIISWQSEIHSILKDSGGTKISDVSISQAYGGMRGVKGLICETSAVSADEGLIIRGNKLLDITHILPEQVFYLLLTGDLPDQDATDDIQNQFSKHQNVPEYIWDVLSAMPKDSHPMTMLSTAIQSMQVDSVFVKKYDQGISKSDYWKWILEDGIRLIGVLPGIAAGIYRMRFNKGELIQPDSQLDWAGNFAHMLGFDNEDFKKLMRLYLMLHCDHEGGNASAFTSLTIGSTLSDLYYAVSGGLNALAGPLLSLIHI